MKNYIMFLRSPSTIDVSREKSMPHEKKVMQILEKKLQLKNKLPKFEAYNDRMALLMDKLAEEHNLTLEEMLNKTMKVLRKLMKMSKSEAGKCSDELDRLDWLNKINVYIDAENMCMHIHMNLYK
ncbi:MAG: hypothetical protein ABIH00_11430 [Armatimonadota bacterium]